MRFSIACIGLNSDILNMREQSISTKLSFVRSFHYAQVNGFKDGEKLDDNLMDRHNLCNAAKKTTTHNQTNGLNVLLVKCKVWCFTIATVVMVVLLSSIYYS